MREKLPRVEEAFIRKKGRKRKKKEVMIIMKLSLVGSSWSFLLNFIPFFFLFIFSIEGIHSSPLVDSFESCFNESDPSLNDEALFMGPKEYSRSLIRGSHKFSIDLLRYLANFESKDSSNGLLVSPFSVWSALLATYMGSKGSTESEIKTALSIQDIPKQAVGMSYQGLRLWYNLKKDSSGKNGKYSYSAANRIFINDRLSLNHCIREHFSQEVEAINFTDSLEAVHHMNEWVSNMTRGKIKQLMAKGSVNPWTQMVLANAVYFQSKWLYQFDSSATEQRHFQVTPSESMQIPFMVQTANLMIGTSDKLKLQVLDLPYADSQFSMLILLPDPSRGIDGLVRILSPQDIYELVGEMYEDEVQLSLPKFKMEQEFDLAGPLYSMGIKNLFDPRFADLSGFFQSNSPHGNGTEEKGVTVNSVVHKTLIKVDEEGTEAAAATAFLMARSGRPAFPTKFIADRPFLFIIRDTATNVILFIGVVRRPGL